MKWTRILAILLLLAGVAAALWWAFGRDRDQGERYDTVAARLGDLEEVISANGTVNPVRVVNVGSQVSGTVEALYVDFNDRVAQGQVLLELDPQLFRARLAQSEASLANARAQADLARANERRAAELRRQEFISRQDYEQAVASARTAAAQVDAALASVAQDRANLGFSIIRAPAAGVIISRQVDIGQTVAASFQTPTLFTIARDLTQMQIEAAVAEADIARVKTGQSVRFTVDAFGPREFTGTVSQVRLNPTTQQNVVTFTVVVDVPNPDGALLPGMTVDARFLVQQHRNVLLVPNAAMSWKPADWTRQRQQAGRAKGGEGFGTTIFVLGEDGEPQARRVQLGAADNDVSIVTGGALKAGEPVIVDDAARKAEKAAGSGRPPPPGGG